MCVCEPEQGGLTLTSATHLVHELTEGSNSSKSQVSEVCVQCACV